MTSTSIFRLTGSTLIVATALWFSATAARSSTPRFFADDPLAIEIDSRDASNVAPKSVNLYYDEARSLFALPGDPQDRPALSTNTIDEVPDSSWFTNRLVARGRRSPTAADVSRGPRLGRGPAPGPWTVISSKAEGVTPGFRIADTQGEVWFIKVDPPKYPELATGAEMIVTRLFHSAGYHVPENHLVTIRREDLVLTGESQMRAANGRTRQLRANDLNQLLRRAATNSDGRYRVIASRALAGVPLGPFQFTGTRPDDPNDVIPHEHRRELRGLRVLAAWVNHADSKTGNTLDTLVLDENGQMAVRHHLIDFGSTLGSAAVKPREFDEGHQYIVEPGNLFANALSFGLNVRPYERVRYTDLPGVGRFSAEGFDPARWRPRVPNAAFVRADTADLFWGARRVMAFSDDMIRAAVATAQYRDPRSTEHVATTLIARRDRIGEAFLPAINPIVDPEFDGLVLSFRNAAVDAGVSPAPAQYRATWYSFDNATEESVSLGETASDRTTIPASPDVTRRAGAFLRVDVAAIAGAPSTWASPVRIYFTRAARGWQLVGLERH